MSSDREPSFPEGLLGSKKLDGALVDEFADAHTEDLLKLLLGGHIRELAPHRFFAVGANFTSVRERNVETGILEHVAAFLDVFDERVHEPGVTGKPRRLFEPLLPDEGEDRHTQMPGAFTCHVRGPPILFEFGFLFSLFKELPNGVAFVDARQSCLIHNSRDAIVIAEEKFFHFSLLL